MNLSGLIYLHDITLSRLTGSARVNIEQFEKLCGKENLHNVILATSKWSQVDIETGRSRQQQLVQEFWKPMIERGSKVLPYHKGKKEAREIVHEILQNQLAPLEIVQRNDLNSVEGQEGLEVELSQQVQPQVQQLEPHLQLVQQQVQHVEPASGAPTATLRSQQSPI